MSVSVSMSVSMFASAFLSLSLSLFLSLSVNAVLCIWFNTLDEGLIVGVSALLNCLIYYYPNLINDLLPLQLIPIALTLLAAPAKLPPAAVPEIVRLVQALSCNDDAAALVAAHSDAVATLLSLFTSLSDDEQATATCDIIHNVWHHQEHSPALHQPGTCVVNSHAVDQSAATMPSHQPPQHPQQQHQVKILTSPLATIHNNRDSHNKDSACV